MSVRVSAPALMRVSSPGMWRAAPAWDTGEQTSRGEPGTRAGAVRGEKTQVQTWVWHSLWLHRQCRQPSAGSELCTESLQHSAQDIAGVRWAAVRAGYWIWSEQLSDQLTAAEISSRLQRLVVVLVKCRTVVINSNNINSTCWPQNCGGHQASGDWSGDKWLVSTLSLSKPQKSSQNATNICRNCVEGKRHAKFVNGLCLGELFTCFECFNWDKLTLSILCL